MTEEITLTLNSPITDEQWDAITDVDFEHTDRISFHTKHGKDVEFVKRKKGRWIGGENGRCSECGHKGCASDIWDGCKEMFCPSCGAKIEGTEAEE